MRLFSLHTRTEFSIAVITLSIALFCTIATFPATLHAVGDDFTVTFLVGGDNTPPSIPGSFTATPVASTQIDLAWTASTDNYILSGYHVWRDDVQIGTTTSTSYSDTGLTPSTTYAYYVTAYDSFFNESASSTLISTTTPQTPAPTPTPTMTASSSSETGTWFRPLANAIVSIEIIPYKDSVVIRYETRNHVRSVIQWGRTSSYELGSLAEGAFSMTHETRIVGLSPATLYRFTIEGENSIGRKGEMYSGMFITLPPDDTFPPGNVLNLTAQREGDNALLSWENPDDPDFAKVRVMRNSNFYPSDIADGWVIYEGQGTRVRDADAFESDSIQYYTVFTYDFLGNISSGAVIAVSAREELLLPPADPAKNEINLIFSDISWYQEGIVLAPLENSITIDGAKQLTISIPYERLPEHLKIILVTIGASGNSHKTFTFLLRVNAEKTAYTGTLAPFGKSGNFPVTVTVFDFKTAQVGYVQGTLNSSIDPIHTDSGFGTILMNIVSSIGSSYLVWFIALLLLLILTARRLAHLQ